ncbi:TetR/AcrR family transcriptional regulator [Nocardia spumae]|uniref:TetR/AcrR family transcriptional regulator n=1 Tax=Nocardia spumae TaxID=2887190 RepID=UPI001D13DABE|nr:TetR/AcrR family transcriptional regulator [Nocardia spumae]
MTEPLARKPRERYREQVRAEIKQCAWEQIATAGASALSLNAIAKRMGMSGPALYRYFTGRDELITELVRDAYRSLADALRTARERGADLTGLAVALRDWALADPQRYFLIYGTPVPGYRAPGDTVEISDRIMSVLVEACAELPREGPVTAFDTHLDDHRRWAGDRPEAAAVLHRAISVWTRLHGVLSLELAGHFAGMRFDPALLYDAELNSVVKQ